MFGQHGYTFIDFNGILGINVGNQMGINMGSNFGGINIGHIFCGLIWETVFGGVI